MSQELSRRNFVAQAAALAATAAVTPSRAASNKISLGVIGTGGRGYYLTQRAFAGNAGRFQVEAVCDTYSGNLARAKDFVQTTGKNTPKTFVDYKDLLNEKSIDAV